MSAANKNSRFIADSAIYLFSSVLNAAIPFLLLPVLTRYLLPAEYGRIAMFQTLIAVLGAFTGLSVHGAANRKYFDEGHESDTFKSYVSACMQILVASSLLALAILVAFGNYFSSWLELDQTWILIAAVTSAAGFVINIRLGQWQVRSKAIHYGVFQILQSLMSAAISLWLVIALAQGANGRLIALATIPCCFALIAIFSLSRDQLINFSWRPDFIKDALMFGIPLVPHAAGAYLLTVADRFVINTRLGLELTGIYMVAVQLAAGLNIVFEAINRAYVPWLFDRLTRNNANEKRQIVQMTYLYFLFLLLLSLAAFWLGPHAVTLIAGEQYRQAGEVIGWLALGQIFGGMYLMVTNYIFYSKRTGLLSLVTLSCGALNLLLLLLLVNTFGIVGAAKAFAAAMFFQFVFTWIAAQKRYPMPWFSLKNA